jgi:ribosome biogenesis protein ENP2
MNVQKRNDVTIYNLSSGPTIPEWLGDRAKRNLAKRDENIRRRIELIQDFQMPSSSSKVIQSADGRYIMVGGTYPPRVRCYDVHDLTMKFERYVNSEIVDMVMLGDDYGKMALMMDDRTIAFHAHYGTHESVRIPKFGRAMAYESTNCELLVASSGAELYRLNLEEGRFSEPWSIEPSSVSASCISVAPSQPLAAVGCNDGVVRFWDNRSPDTLLKPFLKLDVQSATAGYGFADEYNVYNHNPNEITSVAHDPSGLYMAAGTAGGLVALYDVRSSKPLHIKEHKHGMPIHTLKFHPGSGCVLSSDEKLVKVWKYKATGDLVNTTASERFGNSGDDDGNALGAIVANVEGGGKFNSFIMAGDEKDPWGYNSGLLLCATDQPKLECYYIPKVGLAPKWCSFLENITEELEERDLKGAAGGTSDLVQDGQETVFENYKFVSRDDLEKLGISDLVGTPMLRGYMHGFFMDINLYNRVRAVANPFEYEEYRKKKLKERLDAKRASRIAPKGASKKKTSVNPELAQRLEGKAEATTKSGKVASQLLSDDRFGHLFTNPDYQIDEEDINFKLRNPSGVAAANIKRKTKDDMDSDASDSDDEASDVDDQGSVDEEAAGFRRVESDEEDEASSEDDDGDDYDSDSDEDGIRGGKVRGEAYDEIKSLGKKPKNKKQSKDKQRKKPKKAVMYEADDLGDANEDVAVHAGLGEQSATNRVKDKIRKMNMPLEKRFQVEEEDEPVMKVVNKGGTKEITYIPVDARKKREEKKKAEESNERGGSKRQRRGVGELGLARAPFKNR